MISLGFRLAIIDCVCLKDRATFTAVCIIQKRRFPGCVTKNSQQPVGSGRYDSLDFNSCFSFQGP